MLKIYIAEMKDANEVRAKRKGRSPQRGSAFGVSLLEYAVADTWGIDLPEMSPPGKGKPVFVHETDNVLIRDKTTVIDDFFITAVLTDGLPY
jgi:hypothetical protein